MAFAYDWIMDWNGLKGKGYYTWDDVAEPKKKTPEEKNLENLELRLSEIGVNLKDNNGNYRMFKDVISDMRTKLTTERMM